ncbi:hypothetical protein [Aliarcobacter cryaerophilus]|uniref:hypothetical protein n=1 Tax=Aliarcobacter cryaerophilus TaxID=28198 RepID=UPI003DA633E0
MKIEWDDTLQLSNNKYLSSEISTIQKDKFIDGKFEELKLTAKEWIIYEIEKCKKELEKNKKEIKLKAESEKDLKELVLLKKYFNKHITNIDIFGLHSIGEDKKNQDLDENFIDIKNLINEKVEKKKQKIDNIQKLQTDIKRISLENIKLILQKENVKKFSEYADTLLKINDITLGKNHKQTIFHTDTYTQNNVELYIKKLK